MVTLGIVLVLVFICFVDVNSQEDFLSPANFTRHERLDANYELFWKTNDSHIMFKTQVKTKGYIGFGLSPNGGMANSDMVIGWMKDGQAHFSDRHSVGQVLPVIDAEQNWHLIMASEDETYTTLVFYRLLETCDKYDIKILKDTSRIIFSYHPTDPESETSVLYHGASRRGTRSLMLLDPANHYMENSAMPDDVIVVDFLNNKFQVPANETHYNCIVRKLETLHEKHHMIRYEPVLHPGHEQIVHHIVLYYCTQAISPEFMDKDFSAMQELPHELINCDQVFIAWAIGGQAFSYPDHVGHPLGTDYNSGYFMLETHYNNPEKVKGIVDSSGLRLYLTKQLRTYDAAIIDTGVSTDSYQIIPPFETSFISSGYCHEDCLNQGLAGQPISVLAVLLHAHLLGRKIRTRHFRNGTELPPLMEDNHYDFNYQQMRLLPEERIIQKGDSLITECDYDSTSQTDLTYGGLPSTSEMCQAFLLYYPRLSLSRCLSRLYYKLNGQFVRNDIFNIVNINDWTSDDVRAQFRKDVATSPFINICYFNSSQLFFNITTMSPIQQMYIPDTTCA